MTTGDERHVLARHTVTTDNLATVRDEAAAKAHSAGLDPERADRFALAVHEIAANAIEHGGGAGEIILTQDDETLLYADVADYGTGAIAPGPYAPPAVDAVRGRGLWLSQELCDDLQVSGGPAGSVVRVQMELQDVEPGDSLPGQQLPAGEATNPRTPQDV